MYCNNARWWSVKQKRFPPGAKDALYGFIDKLRAAKDLNGHVYGHFKHDAYETFSYSDM